MVSSPASTVSSDLYPISEYPREETKPSPARNTRSPNGKVQASARKPGYAIPETSLQTDKEILLSHGNLQSGLLPGPNEKRKRDSDEEFEHDLYDSPPSNGTEGERYMANGKVRNSIAGSPGHKRPRTETHDALCPANSSTPSRLPMLPGALWQRIFCYVPPMFLGRLLRVNRAFNYYLVSTDTGEDPPRVLDIASPSLKAESIWAASRRRFCPGIPNPIRGMTELAMWKLLRGRNCQICGRAETVNSSSSPKVIWKPGPGDADVKVVWPFGVRCCGPCLPTISRKEIDLSLFWECPFFLLQALPFAFTTEGNHVIGHNDLQNNAPSSVQLSKRYYETHLADIKKRFEHAQELGTGSAEEWTKGLAQEGQQRIDDMIRWEQWEAKGGLRRVNAPPPLKTNTQGNISMKSKLPHTLFQDERPSNVAESHSSEHFSSSSISQQATANTQAIVAPFRAPYVQPHPHSRHRPERNIWDINEQKGARRAEIERRCTILDPPILPTVLVHMDSFQAAIQISQPMTDLAWDILRPRLLAQLPYATRRESERIQHVQILEEQARHHRQEEARLKEKRDTLDHAGEIDQVPVKDRLGLLADDVIKARWSKGLTVTKETCPKFAADVLVKVRERFYANVAKQVKFMQKSGEISTANVSDSSPTRTLTLEDMKYLFDFKIKSFTDQFQKELFLCNGCDGNFKFYALEGVIQHFAAKHTTGLSLGNAIVHWRSEWPEHPPFNPNPSSAVSAYYHIPTPGLPGPEIPEGVPVSEGIRQNLVQSPNRTNIVSKISDGRHPISDQPAAINGYSPTTNYAMLQESCTTSQSTPQHGPRQDHIVRHPARVDILTKTSLPPPLLIQTEPQALPQELSFTNTSATSSPQYDQMYSNSLGSESISQLDHRNTGLISESYQRQLEEMARHAREVFMAIGGIKDLPGSVRIYVTIQLTVSRFKAGFPSEPSLAMFIDGLDRSAVMRPVRSVNGLACKICTTSGKMDHVGDQTHRTLVGERRSYTLPHLAYHFKNAHTEVQHRLGYAQQGKARPKYDWKHDMIDLPEMIHIAKLIHASGLTDHKLDLIARVFPDAFASPLPRLRGPIMSRSLLAHRPELNTSVREQYNSWIPSAAIGESSLSGNQNDQNPRDRVHGPHQPCSTSARAEFETDDEYDPRRPALFRRDIKLESHGSPKLDGSQVPMGHQQQFFHAASFHDAEVPNGYSKVNSTSLPSIPHQTLEVEQCANHNSLDGRTQRKNVIGNVLGLDHRPSVTVPNYHAHSTPEALGSVSGCEKEPPANPTRDVVRLVPSIKARARPNPQSVKDTFREVADNRKHASSRRGFDNGTDGRTPSHMSMKRSAGDFGENGVNEEDDSVKRGDRPPPKQTSLRDVVGSEVRSWLSSRPQAPKEESIHIPYTRAQYDTNAIVRQPTDGDGRQDTVREVEPDRFSRHSPLWRESVSSPQQNDCDTLLYRTRSPVEEDRRDVKDVLTSRNRSSRSNQIISHEYQPTRRYEDMDDIDDEQQQVDYVPIRYQDEDVLESNHYAFREPIQRSESNYYARHGHVPTPEVVYESNGQLFYLERRRYQEDPAYYEEYMP